MNYNILELDASLSCPGRRDETCAHWDHTVQLYVCCDRTSPHCNLELGRWITAFRGTMIIRFKQLLLFFSNIIIVDIEISLKAYNVKIMIEDFCSKCHSIFKRIAESTPQL